MTKKILTVLGARPQFIKAACLSKVFIEYGMNEVIVHSGQHYDENMSHVFFDQLKIPKPSYQLNNIGKHHGEMTGEMLKRVEEIIFKEDPYAVLVYGDTNTTLAAALAARKLNKKLIHVEAGLRNNDMSIPEEVNRVITDRISDILFCPTQLAVENLKKEGFDHLPIKIVRTGDIMADSIRLFKEFASQNEPYNHKYILSTIHRASNTLPGVLKEIVIAFNEIAKEIPIVLPLHPRTKNILSTLDVKFVKEVEVREPVGYFEMINLMKHCSYVITDSGGLQKESYIMGKKTLLLMEYTPWAELVENSFSQLTPSTSKDILTNYTKMKELDPDFKIQLYGDGRSAYIIADEIKKFIQ